MRHATTAALFVLLTASSLLAGVGPQNTAVVVNADSFASKAVANHYVALRNIPACNLIELHLNQLQDFEQIGVEDFRNLILVPVLDQIRARGLSDQIDCIAYSVDIPYAAYTSSDMAGKKFAQVITPVASTNSW